MFAVCDRDLMALIRCVFMLTYVTWRLYCGEIKNWGTLLQICSNYGSAALSYASEA